MCDYVFDHVCCTCVAGDDSRDGVTLVADAGGVLDTGAAAGADVGDASVGAGSADDFNGNVGFGDDEDNDDEEDDDDDDDKGKANEGGGGGGGRSEGKGGNITGKGVVWRTEARSGEPTATAADMAAASDEEDVVGHATDDAAAPSAFGFAAFFEDGALPSDVEEDTQFGF
jgi:hypothetical protein